VRHDLSSRSVVFSTQMSLNEPKASFDAFNKDTKRLLREMREMFPSLSSGIGMLLVILKVGKHMGRKIPHRYFVESVHRPLGNRILARDSAFFESSAFVLPSNEALARDMQEQWALMGDADRDVVWSRMADLLQSSSRIVTTYGNESGTPMHFLPATVGG
jgi:hypothetical protein